MSDEFRNELNDVQSDDKKEKARKISDAVGELSEKIVSDTDSKRKLSSETKTKSFSPAAAGIWRARKIWIPAASAAACGAIVLGVALSGGIFRNDFESGSNVHITGNSEQNLSENSSQIDEGNLTANNSSPAAGGSNGENNAGAAGNGSENSGTNPSDKNGGTGGAGETSDSDHLHYDFGFQTEPEPDNTDNNAGSAFTEPEVTTAEAALNPLDAVYKPGTADLSEYVEVLGQAEYPDTAFFPTMQMIMEIQKEGGDSREWNDWFDLWFNDREERVTAGKKIDLGALTRFDKKTSSAFLSDSGGENRVYSPANIYMAMSVLAELTDGESRKQILDLTGFDDIEGLREQAAALWKGSYCFDGVRETVLASSLWLNSGIEVNSDTVNEVADEYFASVFRGDMASEDTLAAMKEWLNDQTGGLLKNSADNLTLSPDTIMTLCSTVYFHAKWDDEFDQSNNESRIFHGYGGDKEVEFMNIMKASEYFWGEDYGAARLRFDDAGEMWFILPDEDKDIDDVINSGEYLDMVRDWREWENKSDNDINYYVPKFDVSSDINLTEGLKSLGVGDIFDNVRSDFSPLLKNPEGFALDKAEHAARVVIDEQGCTAAAYTVMAGGMGGPPDYEDIDFVLDRPFLFVVTGVSGNVLFVGTVYDID